MKKFRIESGSRVTMYLSCSMEIEAEDADDAESMAVDIMLQRGDVYKTDMHVEEVPA